MAGQGIPMKKTIFAAFLIAAGTAAADSTMYFGPNGYEGMSMGIGDQIYVPRYGSGQSNELRIQSPGMEQRVPLYTPQPYGQSYGQPSYGQSYGQPSYGQPGW